MTKKTAISMAVAAFLAGVASCNSSSSEYYSELDGSAMVKNFTLVENDKVLADLDSVFFSIDLVSGDIFNADSLPMGTKISALAANIITDNASAVKLYIPRPGQTDSVVDYTEHSADTINFSNGPVRLEVVSLSGTTTKDYYIRVNVHTVKGDSLCWGDRAFAPLPAPAAATAQHTVRQGTSSYTFSTDGTAYTVAATSDYVAWDAAEFTPGFDMDVRSVVAGESKLFALSKSDGTLYTADAAAGPWQPAGAKFHSLYGVPEGDVVMGCVKNGGVYTIETYPSCNHVIEMPAGMPVEGFSPAVSLDAPTASSPQMLITGGRQADGNLIADTYGYDGNRWARISVTSMPKSLEGVAVAPYYSLRRKTVEWRVEALPTLLAFGGINVSGKVNDVVYMSRDWGMHWQKADSLLQPPAEMPAVYGAQAIVADRTHSISRAASPWTELGTGRLPLGARPENAVLSRAVAPIDEWEVPYVYLFGGYDENGRLNPTVWRGVITRFTFTPIQ